MAYPRHFVDSVLVENTSERPLPTPIDLDEATLRKARRIEQRAHLTSYDPNTHQEPLSAIEEEFNVAYQRAKTCQNAPRWNGIDFPFAKKGAPGSVWELPLFIANFLTNQMRKGGTVLRILAPDDVCSVEPLWRVLPSDNELAFKGFKSESDLVEIDRQRAIGVGAAAGNLTSGGLNKTTPSGVSVANLS
jgi:hypothetical protein